MADRTPDKPELRRRMRELRRSIDDRPERSEQLWSHVTGLPSVVDARRILSFRTIIGEPEVAAFESWCFEHGTAVAVPEDGVDPSWPDVVIVPGLAFPATGRRLGQGGGWYDRFLVGVRDDCVTVGVCFHEQVLADVAVESHDRSVDHVVTDRGLAS
jgi:5-formyltetrahydrofolate cyclo-ligase